MAPVLPLHYFMWDLGPNSGTRLAQRLVALPAEPSFQSLSVLFALHMPRCFLVSFRTAWLEVSISDSPTDLQYLIPRASTPLREAWVN